VYASWNGATEVRAWRVLAGSAGGALATVGTAARSGFETEIPVAARYDHFEVQALSASGQVIGASRPFGVRAAAG
jgi:hypothetical protein